MSLPETRQKTENRPGRWWWQWWGAEILRHVSEAGAIGLTHGGGEQRKGGDRRRL